MTYAAHSSQNERALQSKTDPADAQEHKEQRHHLEARLGRGMQDKQNQGRSNIDLVASVPTESFCTTAGLLRAPIILYNTPLGQTSCSAQHSTS